MDSANFNRNMLRGIKKIRKIMGRVVRRWKNGITNGV